MQLEEAKTGTEFSIIILYNRQKKKQLLLKRTALQEFFYLNPQSFLSAQSQTKIPPVLQVLQN